MLDATELLGDRGRGGKKARDCDMANCVSSSSEDEDDEGEGGRDDGFAVSCSANLGDIVGVPGGD